ncbi:polysaccharide biosynthesis/export family protein [Labilibacter marinus]|uniref:polysaccharide biosynthesis/export family protein n=1 Tax=Labilibacter marinus TaxID=1477105 RepID=UPI0008302402|nr:polysaccharide biosynthesis/export family protein [Labilibacter marinus]
MTQKRLEYVQEPVALSDLRVTNSEKENAYRPPQKHKVKPNDELLIKVSSFDDVSFNFFGNRAEGRSIQASNELAMNSFSYSVDVDGNVFFPVVGKVKLAGLTIDEAREKIRLILLPYFDQPNVEIKFAFKKVSVIGEVNDPGYYTYTKDQITIFEVIALAGDLTLHGDRKEVVIIRNEDDVANKYVVDMTDDNLVFNYNYYLQPDDVVYIRPRRSVKWQDISIPITLVFSTITTALLVINAIQN